MKTFFVLFFCLSLAYASEMQIVEGKERDLLLSTIRENVRSVQTLACLFRQEKHLDMLKETLSMTGWCYLHKPGAIRWEYVEPLRKAIVWRENKIHIYKVTSAGLREVRTRQEEYLKIVYRYIIAFFDGNFTVDEKDFTFSAQKDAGGQYYLVLDSTNKFKRFLDRIVLQISPNKEKIDRVSIYESDKNYTVIHFYNFILNPVFQENLFQNKMIDHFHEAYQ